MVGDALGDLAAAQHADALFYPILVGKEKTSWERLVLRSAAPFPGGRVCGCISGTASGREQRETLK